MNEFNKNAGMRSHDDGTQKSSFFYIARANQERKSGLSVAALRTLQDGLKQHPQSHQLWEENAKEFVKLGMKEDARDAFAKAYELKPQDIYIVMSYGRFLTREKDFDRAEEVYLNALTNDPRDYRLLTVLGNVYQETFAYELAAACFGKALEINPDDSVAQRRVQEIFVRFKEEYTREAWESLCARHTEITGATLKKPTSAQPPTAFVERPAP